MPDQGKQDQPTAGPSSTSTASADLTAPTTGAAPTTQEVLAKFQQLGVEAQAEEDDEDEEDGEGEDGPAEGADGVAGAAGGGGEGSGKKKKKKKKGKAGKAVAKLKALAGGDAPPELIETIRGNMDPADQGATDEELKRALKAVDLMKILDGQLAMGNKSSTKALGEHKFWKTQPVPQLPSSSSTGAGAGTGAGDKGDATVAVAGITEGPIDPLKTPQDVKQEPGALPAGFEWCTVDIKDDQQKSHEEEEGSWQCKEVYVLLSENYVEDDDAMFRFRYSKEFLFWSLTPPGYISDWHVGVRAAKSGKLVAFISGIKVDIRVRSNTFPAAEINFLCVHKKLRSKRLAPVLIKEVTRRVNLTDVWQAIYTAGVVLPTPFATCRYFHRNLNPPKLVDIGFAAVPRGSTIARMIKTLGILPEPKIPGFRAMEKKDVKEVGELLRRYLERYEVAQMFDKEEEVEHWFLGAEGLGDEKVIWTYVVESALTPQDPTTHRITDFASFFSLPSSIMKHAKYDVLNAAYMFYYASDVISQPSSSADRGLASRLNELVGDLLCVAKQAGFDVLNALTLLDNNLFIQEQKFGAGDGYLNYYLYNWSCAPIDGGAAGTGNRQSSKIGVVML